MLANRIAFTGYSRSGKTEASKVLIELGWADHAFGSIVKEIYDPIVQKYLGYSAFTEDNAQKHHIRPLLEHGGDVLYQYIFDRYFQSLPEKAVNQRLVKPSEAIEWRRLGGVVVEVSKPGLYPETEWELKYLRELREQKLIDRVIHNNGSIQELRQKVLSLDSALSVC